MEFQCEKSTQEVELLEHVVFSDTQAMFEEEASANAILETAQPVPQAQIRKEMSKNERLHYVDNNLLVKFLMMFWHYGTIIENHLKVKKNLEQIVEFDEIPQLNKYHEMIKEFLMWKKSARISGSVAETIFHDWIVEDGFYMIYMKTLDFWTKSFIMNLQKCLRLVKRESSSLENTATIGMSSMTANTMDRGVDVQPSTSSAVPRVARSVRTIHSSDEDISDSQLSDYSRNLKKGKTLAKKQKLFKNPFTAPAKQQSDSISLFKEHLKKRQQEAFPEEFPEEEEEHQTPAEKRLFNTEKTEKSVSFADLVEGDIHNATTAPTTGGISSTIYVRTSAGQLEYGCEVYPGCTVVKFQVSIKYFHKFFATYFS